MGGDAIPYLREESLVYGGEDDVLEARVCLDPVVMGGAISLQLAAIVIVNNDEAFVSLVGAVVLSFFLSLREGRC
jgi:hypothetical protein